MFGTIFVSCVWQFHTHVCKQTHFVLLANIFVNYEYVPMQMPRFMSSGYHTFAYLLCMALCKNKNISMPMPREPKFAKNMTRLALQASQFFIKMDALSMKRDICLRLVLKLYSSLQMWQKRWWTFGHRHMQHMTYKDNPILVLHYPNQIWVFPTRNLWITQAYTWITHQTHHMFGIRPQTNNDLISPSQAKLSIDQQ